MAQKTQVKKAQALLHLEVGQVQALAQALAPVYLARTRYGHNARPPMMTKTEKVASLKHLPQVMEPRFDQLHRQQREQKMVRRGTFSGTSLGHAL